LRERLNQKFLDADGCFLLGFSHCSLSLIKQPRQSHTRLSQSPIAFVG
jgi:hypothetical protein